MNKLQLPTAILSIFLSVFITTLVYQDGTMSAVEMRYLIAAAVSIVIGLLTWVVLVITDGSPRRYLRRQSARRLPPQAPPKAPPPVPSKFDGPSGPRPGY